MTKKNKDEKGEKAGKKVKPFRVPFRPTKINIVLPDAKVAQ